MLWGRYSRFAIPRETLEVPPHCNALRYDDLLPSQEHGGFSRYRARRMYAEYREITGSTIKNPIEATLIHSNIQAWRCRMLTACFFSESEYHSRKKRPWSPQACFGRRYALEVLCTRGSCHGATPGIHFATKHEPVATEPSLRRIYPQASPIKRQGYEARRMAEATSIRRDRPLTTA